MTRGIMPGAVWRPVASFGYPQGRHGQNVPLLFVDHIMSGWKSTMDRPGWQESAGVSAHFGIGDDGSISQYVNIFDASWANGVVGGVSSSDRRGIDLYNRRNPRLALLEQRGGGLAGWRYIAGTGWTMSANGANVWNTATVSIEHENMSGVAWSDAKMAASVAVKKWVSEELLRDGSAPIPFTAEGIIGHADIDKINRAACPGTGRDLEKMIAMLNGAARRWAYGDEQNGLELRGNRQQVTWIGGVEVFSIGDPEGEGLGRIAKNFGPLGGAAAVDVWEWLRRAPGTATEQHGAFWSRVEGD